MRSLDQNAIFRCWIREICKRFAETGMNFSEEEMKQIILHVLGNTRVRLGVETIMSTTKYQRADEDLSEAERKAGIISMDSLLNEMVAWSSREINLELTSPNEEKV